MSLHMVWVSWGQRHCYIYLSSLQHFELCVSTVHCIFSGMLIEWISGHKNTIYLFSQEVDGNSSLGESDGQIRGYIRCWGELARQFFQYTLSERGCALPLVENEVDCKSNAAGLGLLLFTWMTYVVHSNKIDLIVALFCLAVALEENSFGPSAVSSNRHLGEEMVSTLLLSSSPSASETTQQFHQRQLSFLASPPWRSCPIVRFLC